MQGTDPAIAATVAQIIDVGSDIHTVWRAWTDPDWLSGWMAERAEGAFVPGGQIAWHWDSLGLALDLEVVEHEPPHRFSVRGGARGRPPQVQSVSLQELSAGTRIRIAHGDFAPGPGGDDERAGTAAGWHVMLRVLAHYLDGRAGRRRECAAALAPAIAPLRAVGELLHDPLRRAAWLSDGDAPALAREGESYQLRSDATTLSGRVLALAPPFELALGWDEADGVLILRAIQIAPGGPVLACAQAWSWSPEREAWRSARPMLERAVARLVAAAGGAPAGAA
jgi:uncharacterized protein YndB with AHSA1/START domain